MTIRELIESLSKFDPDTPVVVRGYEGGYNDIMEIEETSMQLNVNRVWYYGAHREKDNQEPLSDIPFTSVICLWSYNHIADEDWHNC
jgi:hypothetical protein